MHKNAKQMFNFVAKCCLSVIVFIHVISQRPLYSSIYGTLAFKVIHIFCWKFKLKIIAYSRFSCRKKHITNPFEQRINNPTIEYIIYEIIFYSIALYVIVFKPNIERAKN